jgi:TfoX/Sxy family transcriptional regulator of competence genes
MAYDEKLADRIREYLSVLPGLEIEEKKMFSGMTFMVNGKMCVGVSHDDLMIRFDPALTAELSEKAGFRQMVMKERVYNGYGYIDASELGKNEEFVYWVELCLAYNQHAKSSKKKKA